MADTSKPWEEFASQQSVTGGEKPWEEFGGETKEEGRGLIGHARDLGLSVAKGVIGVPEAAVGLADIPTEGRVGKFLENQDGMLGFRPREAKDFLSDLHTDQYKQQQQDFQDADGVVDKTLHAVQNPSMVVNTVAESLPSMLAGGAVGRGVRALAPALAPVAAGAAGEGAVMAGQQAEQIRQETDDGLLTPAQSGAAVATGVLGSLFSLAGGSLAKKLGIGDADTLLAGGANPGQLAGELASMPAKSIPRKVIVGAISEGFLEELPQSASEQVLQNLALGRDWASGLDEAMVMGTLAGMAMGGPAAVLHGGQPAASRGLTDADATFESTPDLEGQTETTAPLALPGPVYEAGSDGQVRTTVDQNSATQVQRQQEAERLDRIRRGEVTDVTPVPAAPKRSEQMGLDPATGPLSGAAAQAVDSGATDQMVQQAALQQAAEEAQKSGRKGDQVNPETGEITAEQGDLLASDPVTDLQGRLEFVRRQARATGWDAKKIAERDRLQEELDKLAPAPDAGYMQRVGERVKRIEAAQSPDEIAAILAEDQQDEQRHQNAAGRVELAARARGFALDQAAQQQAPTPIGVQDDIQQDQGKADAQQAQAAQPAVSLAPAAESVPAAPATGAKATNLKDAISKVRQAKQKPEQPAALQAVRRGEVGGKLGSGEVVTTSSGRQTTPFPKVSVDTNRKATGTIKAVDQWLMQNALDEARSRGDESNARQFEANLEKPQRADKDAAEEYLFGQQPAVQPRVLKPLVPKSTATDNSASWVIRNKETGEVIAETFDRKKVDALNTEKYEAVPIQQHLASLNKPKVPSIEGKDIGEGWAEFSKESGTVGIPRADMPQIKAEHRGAMVNFLHARGVQHQEETVPADSLKPTQAEFSRDKVAKAKGFEGGNRSILVSRDGHVLDGHHQWMAARDNGEEVKVIRLDAPIRDLVKLAHEFPSSTTDASSGQGATVEAKQVRPEPGPATPDVPKKKPRGVLAKRLQAEAQARAEYFTPGNVVRGYGANYDRVISYNPTESGSWTVTVRSVRKEGDTWVDVPGESERTHMTAPDVRDMKRGPAGRIATQEAPTADEFPLKEAAASYSGISNSSSQRAKSDADEFQTYIDVARDAGAVVARTDAQQAAVEQATRELRADYLAQYRRLMNVRAGTYSGYVVGRSGLNSKQADRRNSAYDRAIDTFVAWQKANQDRVRQAALDARTDEEKAADRQAAEQARADKAQRKEDGDRSLMRRILSWKKGSEPVAITKAAHLAGVNFGKDGYPTSIKLTPTDGSVLTSDKFDLAALFRERGMSVPESKRRVRELVDFVRAEDAARPESEPAEAPKPEPAQSSDSKTPTLDAHVALMQRARSGEATADEFRQAFERTQNARDALVAELGTMKKDDLLKSGGYSFFHRYRNEKKAAIVDALAGRVLEEFALGRSYGPSSYVMSAAGLEAHRQAKASALAELVANTTDDDIKAHAAEVAEAQQEVQARREAQQKAVANPQTLAEFRQAVSYNMEAHGESLREAFMRLTPEQRIRYDELEAESTKALREQAKAQAKTRVASAGQTTAGDIIETKHTKHGHDLFVVQLAERVSREDYDTLNNSAKRLGGSYSSYRGNGAVPGFQFRTREAAEAFRKLVTGDTADAQAVAEARRDAFEDDRSQGAAERLRTMAQALNERADEALNRERKQNTERRARMAASAEASARSDKALAATMNNLADAIEGGKAKFLDTVRQKVQVEFLARELRNAKDAQIRAKYPTYGEQEKHRGEPVDAETVDYSTFPSYTAMRSDLASLARQMADVDGLKKLAARLEKVADDVTEAYTDWAKQNLLSVSRFTRGDQFADFKSREDAERAIRRSGLTGKAIVLPVKRGQNRIVMAPSEAMKLGLWQGDGDKRITLSGEFGGELVQALGRRSGSKITVPWALESAHEKRKRLESMGIFTGSEYRSALREFAALREAPAEPDKIKQMERAMIGRRNDGLDFFPTSDAVVESMLDAAEIGEGMSVLEPSAGMGHIADAIRDQAGVDPDVIELSGERRELLEAKGYRVVGSDFMDVQPRSSYTFGDVFRAPDGSLGVMRGQGGLGSNRVRFQPLDESGMPDDRRSQYMDRDDLVGVEHRGADSGYDRIVMNPPFSKGRDIQHVQHAYSLLKPGGRLVAIMSEGAFFQSNKAAENFRAWLDGLGATSERLPEGSFMDPALPVNTGVNARMVVIDKPAAEESPAPQPGEQPPVQYSFAGRNAVGANLHALSTAQQRIAIGENAEVVRRDTGWHRSADGKWRFEISDHQASIAVAGETAGAIINMAHLNAINDERSRPTVGDVLNHPQLFAAYPDLQRIPVAVMPEGVTALARLRRFATGNQVEVQANMPRTEVASAILHELQHAIQIREGFAMGGSARAFVSNFDKTGAATYRRLAGEVEARNTQARLKMTPRLRRDIAPDESADIPASQVLVSFNGRDIENGPLPQNLTGRPPMTSQSLVRAFDLQFPALGQAVRKMLKRGKEGQRGGLVVIDSADPLRIAHTYARKSGTALSDAVQLFEDGGRINGFYDARSGLTFLVGPNLNPVTAPAVVLHEMVHGQQRQNLDQAAHAMLMNRGKVRSAELRTFLDRVASRMIEAGESRNMKEAAPYIVEQAVIEGREQGFAEADSRFLSWVDSALGKQVGDFLRRFLANIRQWMLRHGLPVGRISVDDLVRYAMAGVESAAEGRVRGDGLAMSQDDMRKARVLQGPPVAILEGNEAPQGFAAVREWAAKLFESQGGKAVNPDLGDVVLDMRAVRDSMAHGKANPYKFSAFAAVKDVLERGVVVHRADYEKGESFYVSAPVVIDDKDDIVTVLVRRDPNMQRMYLHSVATKEYLLNRRVSGADATMAVQPSGSSSSGDVASVLQRLLTASLNEPEGPQFSRSGLRELTSKATAELNKTFSAPGGLSWWHKTIGTMYNLAERSPAFKPVFESAQGFIDDVSYYASDAADLAPKLLPKLETWRDIAKTPVGAEDNKAVAKPVFEGTLMWARDVDGKPVRVDSLAERAMRLTADEKADILRKQGKIPEGLLRAWRGLSPEQFAKMIDSRYESQMLKAGIVWTDAELRDIWKLNDAQVALYREFRAATDRSLDTMARADMLRFGGEDVKELRDQVMDAADAQEGAAILRDHLAQMADAWPERATNLLNLAHGMTDRAEKVAQLQGEGYAPLSRFGKYTVDVVGQDGQREYFSLFETKREANQMAEQMRGAFPGATVSQGTLSEEAYKLFAGITPETLELFGNALGFDSQGDSARDQAFQDYLRLTKTNRSAMRRLIHRKGIAGYSEDVGRVLASFVYSNARQTAAGLHMGDLSEAVNGIPQAQGELKDAAVRLADYIKNPQEEGQAVRGLLFAQYLGGSVASAFVNMTQPVQVTFPWLSQYCGVKRAATELGRAARQMAHRSYQFEPDLARALKRAEDDGVVSPQEVHQLMAQARGSGSLRAGDGTRLGDARALASNSVARLSMAWGKLFGAAEQINRRMTYIASYRIAKAQNMANPDEFARRAVRETQFVYSKASKMRWGRGAVGGTLMTFKTYSVAYLELMHRLWNQGEPGSQERKDGRKAAALMIGMLLLVGGAGGLPFAEDAEDLIDGAAQLMGYNFSTAKAKQEFLESLFGRVLADFIDRGVSGLPGAPLDVSGRLGMGNLIPGTGLLTEKTSHTRDVLEIAGPMGDFASRIASGTRKVLGGDIGSGILEMSPGAVRNAAKGVDMLATGMYRDAKGYKVLDTNVLEAAMKSIGFQPASVATIQGANMLNQKAKAFYNLKAQEIRSMWAAGIFEKDQGKVERARQAIADWNRRNPDQPMAIRVPDIMRRVREMSLSKDERIAKTAPKAMRQQMREDLERTRATLD
ncbi:PLxRFG domain-containing protein [Pseudomonas aeruginosa]|uniref:PLxRFG domain-containing protein n=9 Tax=Pseudomonas aeruginosa TaxID=287 RepID=UPI001E510D45|nr:PLxRFG domain-containing protein [Pseudomonas aeruginosa]EJU9479061.1 PLxRFG domain-containing protein [Pseudomonas aeruginosa]EKU4471960.1 PLxRFG domain-containing protein [Pseudomonas aeruginosa]EKU9119886.1 PLxRFG domain-containing protein [Pseudomonas aeruginosa]EKV0808716.1 PLxRFG domain-containing protein [Pseudomonas aeruginosa]EKV6341480.1 PLxRFG domain-containing protein [Pseudomonas aeruginosa]